MWVGCIMVIVAYPTPTPALSPWQLTVLLGGEEAGGEDAPHAASEVHGDRVHHVVDLAVSVRGTHWQAPDSGMRVSQASATAYFGNIQLLYVRHRYGS